MCNSTLAENEWKNNQEIIKNLSKVANLKSQFKGHYKFKYRKFTGIFIKSDTK